MTKKAMIVLRDETYKVVLPTERCENCQHFWGKFGSSRCLAIEIRGETVSKVVHPMGRCDLWSANGNA